MQERHGRLLIILKQTHIPTPPVIQSSLNGDLNIQPQQLHTGRFIKRTPSKFSSPKIN